MKKNIRINVEKNEFYGNSSVFKQNIYISPSEISYKELYNELENLSQKLNPSSSLGQAISILQDAVKKENKKSIPSIINKFASDFSSSFFANIASATLISFVHSFL